MFTNDQSIIYIFYLTGNPEWVHTKKVFRQNHKYKPIIIYDPNTEKTIGISKCQPSLTLDFAFNCLENAELLMSKNKRDPMTSGSVISESSNSVTSSPTKNGGSYSRYISEPEKWIKSWNQMKQFHGIFFGDIFHFLYATIVKF